MYPNKPLRLCTKCTPAHYENCPDCYGFGVYHGGLPIAARDLDRPPADARPCPTCKSTVIGVPRAAAAVIQATAPFACRNCGTLINPVAAAAMTRDLSDAGVLRFTGLRCAVCQSSYTLEITTIK